MGKKVNLSKFSCFSLGSRKRGISAVVATVLIILITVAAVSIIWAAIIPMIEDNLALSSLTSEVSVVTSEGYTFYDAANELASVQVERGVDDDATERVNIIFSIDGNTVSSSVVAPELGNSKTYVFDMTGYGAPEEVSVAPIFVIGESEKEGSVTSEVWIGTGDVDETKVKVIYEMGVDYRDPMSCSDWFDLGERVDGVYEIDPDGSAGVDAFDVYCDMSAGGYASWDLDAESGNAGDYWGGSVLASSMDVYAGSYSFETSASKTVFSSDLIPISINKNYHIEGWFKSGGSVDSKIYFGFKPYDKDGIFISHQSVDAYLGSETTLCEDANSGDMQIKIADKTSWVVWTSSYVAFNVDDSGNYNDLPNYDLVRGVRYIEDVADDYDCWLIELDYPLTSSYLAGTKVREHKSGGGYLYSAASGSYVPTSWTEYSADVFEESDVGTVKDKWRKGTKFAEIIILANYQQDSSAKLYYDDVKVVEG